MLTSRNLIALVALGAGLSFSSCAADSDADNPDDDAADDDAADDDAADDDAADDDAADDDAADDDAADDDAADDDAADDDAADDDAADDDAADDDAADDDVVETDAGGDDDVVETDAGGDDDVVQTDAGGDNDVVQTDAGGDDDMGRDIPSFGADIHPIMTAKCAPCHDGDPNMSGGRTHASADAAMAYASATMMPETIVERIEREETEAGHMPPMTSEAGQLTADEIALIVAWVEGGTPE